ncbi:hypothetical protein [uncultured Tolumonas sp.]|uniref:hypothetical protein n=1 Tax=uncultured Tolumonas sp. TaxID=263765 RepID=UPI002A0A6BF2|nr:hypothetical protein [uncultured Tolumonas sp.]
MLIQKLNKWLSVNGSVALHKNRIFLVATLSPLVLAIILAYPLTENLTIDLSVDGYANFITIFNLPLWIASASLVLGVVVNRFHSSEQRAATLMLSVGQNHFSNYLNHRDHFQKYLKPISENLGIDVDPFKIYGIIFSSSTPSNADISLSEGVYDYFAEKFESEFWSKMKFSSPIFSKQEVNIYFPRFAKSIGLNMESVELKNFNELKSILIKIRKLYRRAMEYGTTRNSSEKNQEIEESGFAMLTGEFTLWAQNNGFNQQWP